MGKPVTFDHLKSAKKPATRSVRIAMDSEVAERHATAQAKLTTAKFSFESAAPGEHAKEMRKELAKAEQEARVAEEELRNSSVKFLFRSIGRRKFEALVERYPADDKAKEQGVDWDPEKFPSAIIAESLVEPELTAEQVDEIWNSEDWSSADLEALFITAITVNRSRTVVELGNG